MRTLALPQDSSGFVRRRCPHCQREFKTRPFPTDGLAVHRAVAGGTRHENSHELEGSALRACLYCGKVAPPEQWLTEAQRRFVEEHAAALRSEVRYRQLMHVFRTLSMNPRVTFVAVPPRPPPSALPPEPDDLAPVPLICCGEEAKAIEGWQQLVHCPRCGARQGGLLDRTSALPGASDPGSC